MSLREPGLFLYGLIMYLIGVVVTKFGLIDSISTTFSRCLGR